MIRCITFDLDDTLWAVDPVITQANKTMFEWLAIHAPEFTRCFQINDLMTLRKTVLTAQPEIEHSVSLIRIAQLKFGLEKAGYSKSDADVLTDKAFEVFLHARQQVEFFEHAREVLAQLKQQGYILGALSNGNADIHKVGLGDLIDFQFKADDVGQMKPHPLMFQQMLAHTKLKPEQVIHVGDNYQHDVEGANAEGLWTVWVNIKGEESQRLASAEISCLSQLPQRVADITQQAR
ncbi:MULTISPECIES: HAD-IA family hydrolase [unclassified Neptuniibacter]|uniref:HAD family hydrolase n=1 Tax=unclassified Neptuniibacter TaxID=2630693 RepID=UPI000C5C6E7B|nr:MULTISPECIES: HAD-IA family hydrolase [unclassified Neptuniibacter]MAY42951.1 haloacid dehalogenase [Oceanospirillaceae bacterium]|tara:strand:- start:1120 stop:1824 length:705 start_codon:yes stop_codon:yes gene_type:complete